jgi:conjugal transfer ATP-binding protein TraC
MLAKLGSKLFSWLGEKEFNARASYLEEFYQNLSQFYKMHDLFPYESFDEKYQLFINQASIGFVLETPPLVGSSEEMQKEVNGLFQHLLPEGSSLQVMLFADPHIGSFLDRWQRARCNPFMQDFAKRRTEHLKAFAFQSPNFPYSLRNFRCFLSFSQNDSSQNPVVLEGVHQLKNQLKTSLEMLGLPVMVWQPEDLLNTISHLFNMDFNRATVDLKRWDKRQKLSAQIGNADNNLLVHKNALSFRQGDIKVRTYQAAQTPSIWSLHAMGQLIGDDERDGAQIPCPFIIHYGVHFPKQGKPKAKLLAKVSYVERQAASPIGQYLPSLQHEAEELNFVRGELAKGARIVQTEFNIILFAKLETLEVAEQILLNLYLSKEWQLYSNQCFHLPVFLSSLPMMWGENTVQALLHHKKLKTTISTESANLLPLQGEWKGTVTPGMLLCGRRGQVMNWYPFDNQSGNYNVCVVGRSGSGKSVFMQELMTTTLGLGGKVFVLDVGRSFEKTCALLEGQFIEFKAKTPLCLNPFSTIPTEDLEVAQDALAMLKPILSLMAAPTKGLDDMEASLLEQAILETWKQHQQDSNISKIAHFLSNHRDKKAQDLGTMLFPYTESGIYGRFFNGPSTVNLNNPLVVVELEELKERKDLQAVIVQMMIINITNRMFLGDRKTPFKIFFDEAWDLLRGTQSGVFIETLARRLRKYYGSLVVGTQSINDLFANPAAQAAFDNSDWMCLLSQKSESIEQLKKLGRLSLTPLMESQLKSVKTKQGQYAEVMIYGNHGYAIGRLLLDPYSQLLYSTKAEDYSRVQSLKEQGFSLSEALDSLLTPDRKVYEKIKA